MYFGTTPFLTGGHESAGVTAPSLTWFVPEGATGTFFETFILVANPDAAAHYVTFEFLPQSGGAGHEERQRSEAKSRMTVNIETVDAALANAAVATTVTAYRARRGGARAILAGPGALVVRGAQQLRRDAARHGMGPRRRPRRSGSRHTRRTSCSRTLAIRTRASRSDSCAKRASRR